MVLVTACLVELLVIVLKHNKHFSTLSSSIGATAVGRVLMVHCVEKIYKCMHYIQFSKFPTFSKEKHHEKNKKLYIKTKSNLNKNLLIDKKPNF